jgi:hypothetical protein
MRDRVRRELIGYGVWILAGAVFAVPEIWASVDSELPIPTLSGTVGHLERRWEIVSLFVVLVIANALLHAVRVGGAVITRRVEERAAELAGTLRVEERPHTADDPPVRTEMPGRTAATVQLNNGKHVALDAGRVTRDAGPVYVGWSFALGYFVLTLAVVAGGFLIPLFVHGGHATDAEKQLSGEFGYGAMGVAFFLIPGLLAYIGLLVPFPSIFQTILNLEQRAQIVAVVVAGCMTFLMLHLVLYPYPSIIPWFVDLEHLHKHCVQHATELICTSK